MRFCLAKYFSAFVFKSPELANAFIYRNFLQLIYQQTLFNIYLNVHLNAREYLCQFLTGEKFEMVYPPKWPA